MSANSQRLVVLKAKNSFETCQCHFNFISHSFTPKIYPFLPDLCKQTCGSDRGDDVNRPEFCRFVNLIDSNWVIFS